MNLVEQIGSGIHRMREAMESSGLPKPEFTIGGLFTVGFRRTEIDSSGKTSGKTSELIIEIMMDNPKITIPELAAEINITTRAVEMAISNLKTSGLIERVGPAKGGYWEVIGKL